MYGKIMMACELRYTYKQHPLKRHWRKIVCHVFFTVRTHMGSRLTSHRHIPITPTSLYHHTNITLPSHLRHASITPSSHCHHTTIIPPSHTHHTPLTPPSHTHHAPIIPPSHTHHTPLTPPSHTHHAPITHPSHTRKNLYCKFFLKFNKNLKKKIGFGFTING